MARSRLLPVPTMTACAALTPPKTKAVASFERMVPLGGGGAARLLSTSAANSTTVLAPGVRLGMVQPMMLPRRQVTRPHDPPLLISEEDTAERSGTVDCKVN